MTVIFDPNSRIELSFSFCFPVYLEQVTKKFKSLLLDLYSTVDFVNNSSILS